MLAVSVVLYAASKLLFGRRAYAMQNKATIAARVRRAGGFSAFESWLYRL